VSENAKLDDANMNPKKVSEEKIWDEKLLHEINDCKLPSDLNDESQQISDDFFFMDVSLEEDFQGLLDVSLSTDFEGEEGIKSTNECLIQDLGRSKRTQEGECLPSYKKPKSIHRISLTSELLDPDVSRVSNIDDVSSTKNLRDIEAQYKDALHHLALSMRRSEVTRNQILKFRREAEARSQLELAEFQTLSNAEYFLHGYRSTLTVGLDQSRQMLQTMLSTANKYTI
jgi:hypothetical protein